MLILPVTQFDTVTLIPSFFDTVKSFYLKIPKDGREQKRNSEFICCTQIRRDHVNETEGLEEMQYSDK